ncbi:DNA methyltransferase (plasmid) [Limosilactobacillus reuteri]|uniref:Putative DNA methylase n=1 Tax=Limosilactobacillus reuteri subsp. suis (strain ATCC 53608 / LMG 31752 / 1063) TaxID=927703 RepID=F8KGH1_LIMR5|nr:putative DNA methylase [Limosilactobacillus reuteri subsp. suis]CUU13500.1 Type III restriction-modification system enzyme mod [Limosilactobacillus reuteri subsp. suis]
MKTDAEKYNESVQPNTAFLNELKDKLPEFFNKNGFFDLEKFKEQLEEKNSNELSEGYQLDFIGKDYARRQAGEMPTTVIVPDEKQNKGEGKDSNNLFFTGDNLEVLRHLQTAYTNKVDVIYIDPPYNTGKDDFVYPDNFEYSDDKLKEMFELNDDQLSRLKSIQGRSSHSAWMTFMYPRLTLAKRLLTDEGVMFVSIDDNEQANLKLLMDEVFGEDNFIGNLSVENNPKGRKNSKFISVSSEFAILYAKKINEAKFIENIPKRSTEMIKDENGNFVHNSGKRVLVGENKFNDVVTNYSSKKHYSVYYQPEKQKIHFRKEKDILDIDNELIGEGYIRYISERNNKFVENTYSIDKFMELFETNSLQFTDTKIFEKNFSTTKRLKSIVTNLKYQAIINNKPTDYHLDLTTTKAKQKLKLLFDNREVFSSPKSTDLIKLFLTLFSSKNITVFDFFAGSGTTADAVMQLNAEDGGHRKFIMVQLPEKTYKVDKDTGKTILDKRGQKIPTTGGKAAYDAGFKSIDEISRERIRRAAKKIREDNELTLPEDFDGSFKHYRVVKPVKQTLEDIEDFNPNNTDLFTNMVDGFSSESLKIDGDATGEETILTTWLAKDGYPFDADVEEVKFDNYTAHKVEDNRLYLVNEGWGASQTKELLNQLGTRQLEIQSVVIFGYSFNVAELRELENGLKQLDSKVTLIKRY